MTLKQKTKNPFIIWSRVVSITGFWTAKNYWVKALLNDFILIIQLMDESFQIKTKKSK